VGANSVTQWRDLEAGAWLYSPALSSTQLQRLGTLSNHAPSLNGLWILSSGTESLGSVKVIGLTFDAILASAGAVNAYVESSSRDHWLVALPTFHIGGLAILARAHLSGARVSFASASRWSAPAFCHALEREMVTLTSLVPTQLFDLVAAGLKCPPSLRKVFVGGGSLHHDIFVRARELGWPILRTYGLTECASQVAVADDGGDFHILPHVEVEIRDSQQIWLKSNALCSWIGAGETFKDVRQEGWLPTQDLGQITSGKLRLLGRADQVVKILGTLVNVQRVQEELMQFGRSQGLHADIAVLARPDSRSENQLCAFTESNVATKWKTILIDFNRQRVGTERIKSLGHLPELPRTDLGKIKLGELRLRAADVSQPESTFCWHHLDE